MAHRAGFTQVSCMNAMDLAAMTGDTLECHSFFDLSNIGVITAAAINMTYGALYSVVGIMVNVPFASIDLCVPYVACPADFGVVLSFHFGHIDTAGREKVFMTISTFSTSIRST